MAPFRIVRNSHVTQTHFFKRLILDITGSESVYSLEVASGSGEIDRAFAFRGVGGKEKGSRGA